MTRAFRLVSPGPNRYQRYPRTKEMKRVGYFPPNRPAKFDRWLTAPLHVAAGRFRRLAREFFKKPARAERMLRIRAAGDDVLAKKLYGEADAE